MTKPWQMEATFNLDSVARPRTERVNRWAGGLLYVRPERWNIPEHPIIDDLTMRVAAILKHATPGGREHSYHGSHMCVCGAVSKSFDYLISWPPLQGMLTNSLCVHYVAFHRDEVPEIEIERVRAVVIPEELRRVGHVVFDTPPMLIPNEMLARPTQLERVYADRARREHARVREIVERMGGDINDGESVAACLAADSMRKEIDDEVLSGLRKSMEEKS